MNSVGHTSGDANVITLFPQICISIEKLLIQVPTNPRGHNRPSRCRQPYRTQRDWCSSRDCTITRRTQGFSPNSPRTSAGVIDLPLALRPDSYLLKRQRGCLKPGVHIAFMKAEL